MDAVLKAVNGECESDSVLKTVYRNRKEDTTSRVVYENGLVIKGDTLLEVLDKKREILQLPLYIRQLGADAFKEVENLLLIAWSTDQVDSWLPILKARRLTLQIGADIWLPVSPIGGFETAFQTGDVDGQKRKAGEQQREQHGTVGGKEGSLSGGSCIDFQAYDSRFSRIQDGALKLEIALSRLLYPCGLTDKAETAYRQLITRRFRPAMLQLVSGRWNRYHRIPERAETLLRLKKMDRFLKKELLTTAAEWRETGFVRLLTRIFAEEAEGHAGMAENGGSVGLKSFADKMDRLSADKMNSLSADEGNAAQEWEDSDIKTVSSNIWRQASEELHDRRPDLTQFSGLMEKYERMPDENDILGFAEYFDKGFYRQERKCGQRHGPDFSEKALICLAKSYAHRLFHWMYLHPFQQFQKPQKEEISDEKQQLEEGRTSRRERAGEEKLWDLSCDIAVEYMVDRIFGPVSPALYEEADTAGDCEDIRQIIRADRDTFSSGRDTFSSGGDTFSSSRDTFSSDRDTFIREEIKSSYVKDEKDAEKMLQADDMDSNRHDRAWKRQMIWDQLYRRDPVMTGEHIRKQLSGWHLSPEEIEELAGLFRRGSHDWRDRADCAEDGWQSGFRSERYRREAEDRWKAALQKWADSGEGLKQLKRGQTGRRSAAPGQGQEEAKLTKRQGYDFHTYLKQFMVMREDRLLDPDSFDPVYYTYGLQHYQDMPFIEPLETKEVLRLEELVIVIDTSGSCSGKLVRFFLEETWSVFGQEENFFDQFHVRILQCDSIVQEDVKLTSLREAEQYMKTMMIKGGGGTDFREAFTYIRRLQEKGELMHLKGILYFTDGFGTFPATAPGCRTTFVFLKSRFGEVDVPVWADKLLLPLPEGADWEPEYTGAFRMNI